MDKEIFDDHMNWVDRGSPQEPDFKTALSIAYEQVSNNLIDEVAHQIAGGIPTIADDIDGNPPAAVRMVQYRILNWA